MSYHESRHALSDRRFSRLSSILTEANAHHSAVAAAARAATKRTYHARTRAQKLGLSVNTVTAVACEQRLVSTIPPPILDTTPSPPPAPPAPRGRPMLRLIVPRPLPDVPVSGGPYSTVSLSSAAAPAPIVLRGQNNPWCGPTSRFSITPSHPIFTMAPRRAPVPPVAEPPVIPDVPFDEDDFDSWVLGYPASGAADYAESSTVSIYAESSSSSPSGSSGASSAGPTTPADTEMISVLSAKRKSEEDAPVEKRPKYERKSWARGRTLC